MRAITCSIKATLYMYTATKSDAFSQSPQGHAKFTIPGSKRISPRSRRFSYIYVCRYGNFDPRRRPHARRIVGRRSTSTLLGISRRPFLACQVTAYNNESRITTATPSSPPPPRDNVQKRQEITGYDDPFVA